MLCRALAEVGRSPGGRRISDRLLVNALVVDPSIASENRE
jgi:hypothetical protein